MPTSERKNSIDVAIGKRVAELRTNRQFSTDKVAQTLGLTLDEYALRENGIERFSALQIFEIAQLLNVTMADIYQSGAELPE